MSDAKAKPDSSPAFLTLNRLNLRARGKGKDPIEFWNSIILFSPPNHGRAVKFAGTIATGYLINKNNILPLLLLIISNHY